MTSYNTRKVSTRSHCQASKKQQLSTAAEVRATGNKQTRRATRGGSRPATCGAKRKRKEASTSDVEVSDTDDCINEASHAVPAVVSRDTGGRDQHTVNAEGPDRPRRSGRRTAKAVNGQASGQPVEIRAPRCRSASAGTETPDPSAANTTVTVRQPLSPTAPAGNSAAASVAFATAAAFFGRAKSGASDRSPSETASLAGVVPKSTGMYHGSQYDSMAALSTMSRGHA